MGSETEFKETEIGKIPEDWEIVKVKDVAKINELSIDKNFQQDRIEYIDISSVENRQILNVQNLSVSEVPSRAKRIVRNSDILISTVRPNLKHFTFIKKAKSNTIASTGFAVITSYKVVPQYLYYYLTTDEFTNYLSQIADTHTSTYPAFNPDVIENADLFLPSKEEQHVIASILGALDDKIELNRQMNKTLEAIAQAIFKHWFIDFEFPNEQGKPYKSSGGEMVDSELGEIPKGWRVVKNISEQCSLINYGYTQSATQEKIGPKFLRVTDINKGDWIDWTDVPYCEIDDKNLPKYILEKGDIVVARMADPGKLAIFESDITTVFASYLIRIRLLNKVYSCYFYYLMKSKYYQEYILGVTTGSVQKNLNAKGLTNGLPIIVPSNEINTKFNKIIGSLREKINENIKENTALSQIRDTLLPKLMSGRIRVKDAERFIEM